MTAFAILLVLTVILLIAKWNTSNTLFWKLFVSFILGIAACGLYNKLQAEDTNDEPTKVTPMPYQQSSTSPMLYLGDAMSADTHSSKENTAGLVTVILRDSGRIMYPCVQYVSVHSPPPLRNLSYFDTS